MVEVGDLAESHFVVCSLPQRKELLFVDAASGKVIGSAPLEGSRGLAFDAQGRLCVVAGTRVLRYAQAQNPAQLPTPDVLVATGLKDPQQIAFDEAGNLYVSDWGDSHQVKVFSPPPK